MLKRLNIVVSLVLVILLVLSGRAVYAQTTISQARQYAAAKNYNKAIDQYAELYSRYPDTVYHEYYTTLLDAKKYKQAEQLVEKQMTLRDNPLLQIDLGIIYDREGNHEKAAERFDKMIGMVNGDVLFTEKMAKAFTDAGRDDYAIQAYEKTDKIFNAPYYYSVPLANLYAKSGNYEKAIDALLVSIPGQGLNIEAVKTALLEILGNDPVKLQQMQKALVKRINEQPANIYYVELLTWIFTQKNDWEGALIQMEAIDERNKEAGQHLMEFARTATNAKQYEFAEKAYDDIIAKGKESPYYILARSERLAVSLNRIKNNPEYKPEDVAALKVLYDSFLADYPKYYGMQTGSDYATLLAQYGNDVKGAIKVLKNGLADPDIQKNMMGLFKLQLGDYLILNGQLWEASLYYSQVDKEFKQDQLAEEARFRNAKLTYYQGDFDWAQQQLKILKSATSQLIANDAIYLSVLITENVEDSNMVPLQRFATAGLLFFQNKDKAAEAILDSINKVYPKHPLNDDILMVRADMARKHHQYDVALAYLKTIYDQYKEDVLGDDAVFKMAEIYQFDLHKNDLAKHFYEQLIIDYQGSTFVQIARQRLTDMNNASVP
jgi:tetratricopeptide (TPR) repeat protein